MKKFRKLLCALLGHKWRLLGSDLRKYESISQWETRYWNCTRCDKHEDTHISFY